MEWHFHVFVGGAIHIVKPELNFFSDRIYAVPVQVPKGRQ